MKLTVLLMVFCGVVGSTNALPSKLHLDCDALVASGAKAYYYANSCNVFGSSTTMNWDAARADCTQFKNGHLIVLPTVREVNKALDKLDEWNMESKVAWIGLAQANGTSEPSGHWQWHLANNRRVPTTVGHGDLGWKAGEPNESGGEDCAAFGYNNLMYDRGCQFGHDPFCQYDDEQTERKYRKVLKGHRGHPSGWLNEVNVDHRLQCARLCTDDPICRSFSYSMSNQHCITSQDDALHPDYPPQTNDGYDMLVWEF